MSFHKMQHLLLLKKVCFALTLPVLPLSRKYPFVRKFIDQKEIKGKWNFQGKIKETLWCLEKCQEILHSKHFQWLCKQNYSLFSACPGYFINIQSFIWILCEGWRKVPSSICLLITPMLLKNSKKLCLVAVALTYLAKITSVCWQSRTLGFHSTLPRSEKT